MTVAFGPGAVKPSHPVPVSSLDDHALAQLRYGLRPGDVTFLYGPVTFTREEVVRRTEDFRREMAAAIKAAFEASVREPIGRLAVERVAAAPDANNRDVINVTLEGRVVGRVVLSTFIPVTFFVSQQTADRPQIMPAERVAESYDAVRRADVVLSYNVKPGIECGVGKVK
jgi:hypothetical protein